MGANKVGTLRAASAALVGLCLAIILLPSPVRASATTAQTLFQAGFEIGQSTPAYAHWLPLVIVQKADQVADLPDDDRFVAYGADGAPAALDLGQGVLELRILWMPFFAWADGGWVFYGRTATGQFSLAPATELELLRLTRLLGRDPREGYSFNPLWRMWGWLSLIPLLLAWRWWRRRDDARRIAEGVM